MALKNATVNVAPFAASRAAAWARKVGVSHAVQTDGSLKLWYVTESLRARLAREVGPTSEAERDYLHAMGNAQEE